MTRSLQHVVLCVVLTVVFYFVAYLPWSSEHALTENQILKTRQELADFQTTIMQFPEFQANHRHLAGLETHLTSRLYAKNDIIKLFERLQSDAEDLDIRVTEISPPVDELLRLNHNPGNMQAEFLNISVSLEGDFIDLGRYVQNLEQSVFFRGINRSEFVGTADPARGTTLRIDFRALLGSERPKGVSS